METEQDPHPEFTQRFGHLVEPTAPAPPNDEFTQRFLAMEENVGRITELLKQLTQAPTAVPAPPNPISQAPTPPPKNDSRSSRNTRPAAPTPFNGDRSLGRTFFNSVTFYMSVCGNDFADDDARILWVLSYMSEG